MPGKCALKEQILKTMSPNGLAKRSMGCVERDEPLTFAASDLRQMPLPQDWNTLFEIKINEGSITHLPPLPTELVKLEITKNRLHTLPDLPQRLIVLNVSHNNIQEFPICPDTLSTLDASHNGLKKLPKEFPPALQVLKVAYNQLESIPSLKETKITRLGISNNRLKSLTELPPTLESLGCSNNQLTEIRNLPESLRVLVCKNNPLRLLQIEANTKLKLVVASNCNLREIPLLPEFVPDPTLGENPDSCEYYFDGNLLTPEFQAIYDRYRAGFTSTMPRREEGSTKIFYDEVLAEHKRIIAQRKREVESIQTVLKGPKGKFGNYGPANLIAQMITGLPGTAEQQRLALFEKQEELGVVPKGASEVARARIANVLVKPEPLEKANEYLKQRAKLYGLGKENLNAARQRIVERAEFGNVIEDAYEAVDSLINDLYEKGAQEAEEAEKQKTKLSANAKDTLGEIDEELKTYTKTLMEYDRFDSNKLQDSFQMLVLKFIMNIETLSYAKSKLRSLLYNSLADLLFKKVYEDGSPEKGIFHSLKTKKDVKSYPFLFTKSGVQEAIEMIHFELYELVTNSLTISWDILQEDILPTWVGGIIFIKDKILKELLEPRKEEIREVIRIEDNENNNDNEVILMGPNIDGGGSRKKSKNTKNATRKNRRN